MAVKRKAKKTARKKKNIFSIAASNKSYKAAKRAEAKAAARAKKAYKKALATAKRKNRAKR